MCPLISIIIPVKNGANYIKQALEAIHRQNVNKEIIIVDDGSTDDTADIARNYDCTIIKNEISQGPVKAKNVALQFTTMMILWNLIYCMNYFENWKKILMLVL